MEQAAQRARHRNRPPAPCVESLEDRVLLSAAVPLIFPHGIPPQVPPALAAAMRAELRRLPGGTPIHSMATSPAPA